MNIYLIDNNEIDLLIGKKLLEYRDASVSTTVCQSAVKALLDLMHKTIQPDAILLDWHTAELSAEEWLTYYSSQIDQQVPVYILTASIDPRDRQKAEQFEVVKGFFTKPFSQSDIDYLLSASSKIKHKDRKDSYCFAAQSLQAV